MSKEQITNLINSNIPDNTTGAITPAGLRDVLESLNTAADTAQKTVDTLKAGRTETIAILLDRINTLSSRMAALESGGTGGGTGPVQPVYDTELNSATPEGAGVSFAPVSTERLLFNAIPGANAAFINSMFSYNGANSYATLPGEYTGQPYTFYDNTGVAREGTFSNNG